MLTAGAVIDASGTWGDAQPARRRRAPRARRGRARRPHHLRHPRLRRPRHPARYAGKRVVVAGRGASAQNTLVGLTSLTEEAADTEIVWLRAPPGTRGRLRRRRQRPARAARRPRQARPGSGRGRAGAGRHVVPHRRGHRPTGRPDDDRRHRRPPRRRRRRGRRGHRLPARPRWLSEVRLDLDPVLSAPTKLAPLIDPNVHSCGTVYPHGVAELAQPEQGLYLAGMKSYGRAPSFLALTGFEQTRSIVAAIAGDHEAAARVELVLPESGVCGGSGQFEEQPAEANGGGCCAPAATCSRSAAPAPVGEPTASRDSRPSDRRPTRLPGPGSPPSHRSFSASPRSSPGASCSTPSPSSRRPWPRPRAGPSRP